MTAPPVDSRAVLDGLKDFQRRTAIWAFRRMFEDRQPTRRFLIADEVGLGKTHVAKGVIAQVIDHLHRSGQQRHDIVYICSNIAIARQNLRKLVPAGIEVLDGVGRLTMLPLVELNQEDDGRAAVNVLAITPGTSFAFGTSTGRFEERCLAYAFLRELWGPDAIRTPNARRIFWEGVDWQDGPDRLKSNAKRYRPAAQRSLDDFTAVLSDVDRDRRARNEPTVRQLFDELVAGSAGKRGIPDHLMPRRREFIGAVRHVMAVVGISALRPDLVVLDEFQRFKDLLVSEETDLATQLAHRLFDQVDPSTGRATRTLMLSATPYRMFTTAEETDTDHYEDFFSTCAFLYGDDAPVDELRRRFAALRHSLTAPGELESAGRHCEEIGSMLRRVMARTERLAATPDRDGMLVQHLPPTSIESDDLRSYLRFGAVAEAVDHHDPIEYWKAAPYLFNFMERYKLKTAFDRALDEQLLGEGDHLDPGPGLLDWQDVDRYGAVDPQNGRLRWLLENLKAHRAFELLWIPPSLRYYDTGSVYETKEATTFTKRLIFSGWTVVPKVVSALVSYEAERRAFTGGSKRYSADYSSRGGQRLAFRTAERTAAEARRGEAATERRAAAMTTFLLTWPSPMLAELGDPIQVPGGPSADELLEVVSSRIADELEPWLRTAPTEGETDPRWYWAAPLLLDQRDHPDAVEVLLTSDGFARPDDASVPSDGHEGTTATKVDVGDQILTHRAEARAMVDHGPTALGPVPADLIDVLAKVAVGSPAICGLRMLERACGVASTNADLLGHALTVSSAFRSFFNTPQVAAVVTDGAVTRGEDEKSAYWREVVNHCVSGNLQALLDEHGHVLRDWMGHVSPDGESERLEAAKDIAQRLAQALDLRTTTTSVDIPHLARSGIDPERHGLRTRFAVPFGGRSSEQGAGARMESVSTAFNSPFWPFVLTSTSVGQEGLDFHLWCHSVVHWNLPSNPVDLEQREGRVHRYKGHAVRRNIAAAMRSGEARSDVDHAGGPWDELFELAASARRDGESEMVPYWVFQGGARIERYVPILPFSTEAAAFPRLRKTLAAYRLAFGQPRQDELTEYLGTGRSVAELLELTNKVMIDLTPREELPAS